jgi:hypothetical protein
LSVMLKLNSNASSSLILSLKSQAKHCLWHCSVYYLSLRRFRHFKNKACTYAVTS